jgi:hypothetical protein
MSTPDSSRVKRLIPYDAVSGVEKKDWWAFEDIVVDNAGKRVSFSDLQGAVHILDARLIAMVFAAIYHGIAKDPLYAVYHTCSDAPVTHREFSNGFQPTPYICERCGESSVQNDLKYELLIKIPESVGRWCDRS